MQPKETINANDLYTIVDNAILVNIPSPEAVASAVDVLVQNQTLRELIGKNGRNTVLKHFTLQRQMIQYHNLYKDLHLKRIQYQQEHL